MVLQKSFFARAGGALVLAGAAAIAYASLLFDLTPEQIGRVIMVHPWGIMRVEPDVNNDGIVELRKVGTETLHVSLGEDAQPAFTRRFYFDGIELRRLPDGRWQSLDAANCSWVDIQLVDE